MVVCRLSSDTILTRLIKARDYDSYSFTNSSVTAHDIARQFMILEKTTFNRANLKITDNRLFSYVDSNGHRPFKIIHKFISKVASPSGREAATLSCYTTYEEIDYWICPFGNGEGDHDCGYDYYDHTEVVPKTTCFWTETGGGNNGDGGIYGGGEGGGGGSGDDEIGPSSNTDPCTVNGQPATTLCGGGWEPELILTDENGFYYSRLNELKNKLGINVYNVIPCVELWKMEQFGSLYQTINNYQAPNDVLIRLSTINSTYSPSFINEPAYIQNINEASSGVANCDLFPVHIITMPSLTTGSAALTSQQLLEYFRLHINDFIDPSLGTSFAPYIQGSLDETAHWNLPYEYAVGSILHLTLPANNGSIIMTGYEHSIISGIDHTNFTVATLVTPLDGFHPVSGNRRFGIYTDATGGFAFYTSGVDRITTWDLNFGSWAAGLFGNNGFERADLLWRSMQQKMISFITAHGGTAQLYPTNEVVARPKWADIKDYLEGKINFTTLKSRLGC